MRTRGFSVEGGKAGADRGNSVSGFCDAIYIYEEFGRDRDCWSMRFWRLPAWR